MRVGLTGGIGSGKSTICKIFEWFGVPIYNSDLRTKALYINNNHLKNELIHAFGEEMYLETGEIDKNRFSNILSNSSHGKKLNEIVHPYVFDDFENWVSQQNHPYTIKESAILFESGANLTVDLVVAVIAPIHVKLKRIQLRDPHRTEMQILDIMNLQLSDDELIKRSNYIIKNDNSQSIINQVFSLNNEFLQKSTHF